MPSLGVPRASGRPAWLEPPSLPQQVARGMFLLFVGVVMLFPFVYVVAISFSSARDVL